MTKTKTQKRREREKRARGRKCLRQVHRPKIKHTQYKIWIKIHAYVSRRCILAVLSNTKKGDRQVALYTSITMDYIVYRVLVLSFTFRVHIQNAHPGSSPERNPEWTSRMNTQNEHPEWTSRTNIHHVDSECTSRTHIQNAHPDRTSRMHIQSDRTDSSSL